MLTLGIIGYGDAARDFARAAAAHDQWQAVAVGGRNTEKAKKFADEFGMTTSSVKEMAADDSIDVIAVATPPGVHVIDAVIAAAGGKHLIVEKPLALTSEDCTRILNAARTAGVRVMCSQSLQFYPGALAARELMEAGEIGEVVSAAIIAEFNYFNEKRTGWQLDPTLSGGGVVMNPVIHFTDQIRFLSGGNVTAVSAVTGIRHAEFGIEGDASVLYRLDNGAAGMVSVNGYLKTVHTQCRVTGTRGGIEFNFYAPSCILKKNGSETTVPGTVPAETHMCNISYYNHLEFMKRTLKDGAPLKSDGSNGAENVRINLAILQSAATGSEVAL